MDAVAVAEVLVVPAGEIEGVGVVEAGRVAVGRREDDEDGVAGGDVLPAEGEGLGREAPGGEFDGAVVAEEFLDAGFEQRGLPRGEESWRRVRWSGWVRRAYMPFPMRLTVVSNPANSRMNAIAAASFSVRCSPWSEERMSPEMRSSPGAGCSVRASRLRWMRSAR